MTYQAAITALASFANRIAIKTGDPSLEAYITGRADWAHETVYDNPLHASNLLEDALFSLTASEYCEESLGLLYMAVYYSMRSSH